MKKRLLTAALISVLTTPLFAPIVNPIKVTASMEGGQRVLHWSGQSPPYKIQRLTSTAPVAWTDISFHIFTNHYALLATESDTAFYRVRTVHKPKSVTLAWDPNSETDLFGYIMHSGTASGDYSESWPVGNVTQIVLTGLTPGVKYFFAVTAQNIAGLISDFSNEVSYTP